MGIFDKFKKKEQSVQPHISDERKAVSAVMTKEEFIKKMNEDPDFSPGWQAVEDAFTEIYGDQEPMHYGTLMPDRAIFGGDQYLDGISIYSSDKGYKHLVTFGMTTLYGDEDAFGGEWNGWGYEMTMKLKENSSENCKWAIDMMCNLARYTYTSKRIFEPNQCVRGNGSPIHVGSDSRISGLLLVADTELQPQLSVYGRTEFIQLVGITAEEANRIAENKENIPRLIGLMKADGNAELVTDMARTKSYL